MNAEQDLRKHPIRVRIEDCRLRRDGRIVLQDLHFDLVPGDRLAVLGASGSGKSTLLNAMLGYLDPQTWELRGSIRYGPYELTSFTPRDWERLRGNMVRVLFQEPAKMVHPIFRLRRQLESAFRISDRVGQSMPLEHARGAVDEILHELRILDETERMGQYAGEVSGGQLQRVALAMAMGPPSAWFFADEPSNSLDASITSEFLRLLDCFLEQGKFNGLFLVTHDLSIALSVGCGRFLFLDEAGGHALLARKAFLRGVGPEHALRWLESYLDLQKMVRGMRQRRSSHDAIGNTRVAVRNLSYRYPVKGLIYRRGKPVIRDVNFKIRDGEFIGLLGNSGSGKTTLGRCISGMQTDFGGSVELRGIEKNRTSIQYMSQNTAQSFDPNQQFLHHLEECARGRGLEWDTVAKRVDKLLKILVLPRDILNRRPGEVSGGQRQRMSFIRHMMGEPHLVVVDEPFVNLDPLLQRKVTGVLLGRRKRGKLPAAVIISHNLSLLLALCQTMVVLGDGRQLEAQSTHGLLRSPETEEAAQLVEAFAQLYGSGRQRDERETKEAGTSSQPSPRVDQQPYPPGASSPPADDFR